MATAAQTKPYSGPKDPKLPDHVQKMPEEMRAMWVHTFNGVMDETDNEGQAMRLANAAARCKKTSAKELYDMALEPADEGDALQAGDLDVLALAALHDRFKAAPTKREAGADYHAGDFADVPDPEKPSTWKLRLADPPGTMNALQISQAITALQPSGFRGNRVQLGTSREEATRKISTAIGKLGDDDTKKRLRDRLSNVKELIMEFGWANYEEDEDSEPEAFKAVSLDEAVDRIFARMVAGDSPEEIIRLVESFLADDGDKAQGRDASGRFASGGGGGGGRGSRAQKRQDLLNFLSRNRKPRNSGRPAATAKADLKAALRKFGLKELTMELPTPEQVALAKAHGHDLGAKCDMCGMPAEPPQPYGGAVSFSELDAYMESMKLQGYINEASWQFQALQQNIFADEDMDAEEKATALSALAREFQARVRQMPAEEKALLDGERAGRRMNKQQLGMFRSAIDTLKNLVGWANYEESDDVADAKKKALGAGDSKALVSSFKVYQEPDGTYRWVTYSSNAFEDLEKELFTTKALEEAVAYADLSGERGPLRLFHVPGADVGPCDFQSVVGRVLVESGTFFPNPVGSAAAKFFKEADARDEQFGVSIGYLFEKGDERDGVYDWLRIKERSVTPAGRAANPFTSFSLGGIPVLTITDEKKSFLERVIGKDNAAGIISTAERATKALEAAGVRFKENGEPEVAQAAATAAAAGDQNTENAQGEGDEAEAAKQIIGMLGETTKGLEALGLVVKSLADRMETLEKSDDEKIAAQLGPRRIAPNAVQRPSEKASNDIRAKSDAVAAIQERNRVNGGEKDGSVEGDSEEFSPDPINPYIQDLYRTLNLPPTAPAGAAAN